MKLRIKILPVALLAAALCALHAAEPDLEKDFRSEIALYRIRPDQTRSLRRDPDGTPVSESGLKAAARQFYDRLYPLDPGFLKRFKIKDVVFKDTVYDRDGDQYQMLRTGNDLFVDADLDEKQFYTSLFYQQISLMQRSYIDRWEKLNPDGFSYERTRGNLTGSAQKKLDAVLSEWDKHFVNRTAMYSPEIDMAQTFSYMITRGTDATAFAKNNSPGILKKFDMVADILESLKATERGYMETLLSDDLSNLKSFVPYALSVRLEREYSGMWSVLDPEEEEDETKSKTPRRIGDPVEVAGRKVVPLILALETKNSRLFRLLMQHKADPNAVNDKKVSALMLAIANNDPEQVKALLDAGANVSPEAARSGTASGVSAEIAKLLTPYLPGVRKSTAPEKKPSNKASGGNETPDEKLYKRLHEMKFEHLGLEEADVANIVVLLQKRSKQLDPAGKGIQISLPKRYSGTDITLVTENVSLYEMLQLICKNTGLEIRLEGPNRVFLVNPGAEQKETGKNGSAKGQP